jgi:hypothetical protein
LRCPWARSCPADSPGIPILTTDTSYSPVSTPALHCRYVHKSRMGAELVLRFTYCKPRVPNDPRPGFISACTSEDSEGARFPPPAALGLSCHRTFVNRRRVVLCAHVMEPRSNTRLLDERACKRMSAHLGAAALLGASTNQLGPERRSRMSKVCRRTSPVAPGQLDGGVLL